MVDSSYKVYVTLKTKEFFTLMDPAFTYAE